MDGLLAGATAIAGLLAAVLGIFKYFNYRSVRDQKAAVGQSFSAVVSGLATGDSVERLASALLLRRFFNASSEYAKPDMPYADDAIGVIAATLRDEPTGNVQKLLADGLAFVDTTIDGAVRRPWRKPVVRQGLQHRDFQRTNFRSAYLSLEGPAGHRPTLVPSGASGSQSASGSDARPRLDVSGSDFFRSDLSHASLKNAVCVDAAFFESVAIGTVFRDADLSRANFVGADLRNADLRGADLTKADFTGAKLAGARFTGAVVQDTSFQGAEGLPPELDAAREDGLVTLPVGTEISVGRSSAASAGPRVFLGVATTSRSTYQAATDHVANLLRDEGFEVVRVRRDDYDHDRHLVEVREAMASCAGVIVVGLPQLLVEKGVWRQGTSDEHELTDVSLHTPWNDIEAGLAVGLGLPMLAVRIGCGPFGIFDLKSDDVAFHAIDLTDHWEHEVLAAGVRDWARVVLHE